MSVAVDCKMRKALLVEAAEDELWWWLLEEGVSQSRRGIVVTEGDVNAKLGGRPGG